MDVEGEDYFASLYASLDAESGSEAESAPSRAALPLPNAGDAEAGEGEDEDEDEDGDEDEDEDEDEEEGRVTPVMLHKGGVLRGGDDLPVALPQGAVTKLRRMFWGKFGTSKPSRLEGVQLTILGEEELLRLSVLLITNGDHMYRRNVPVFGSVNDIRLGATEHGMLCATCGHDALNCNGHFGHIVLPVAVFHPCFFETSAQMLRVLCWTCAGLLVRPELPADEFLSRTTNIHSLPRLSFLTRSKSSKRTTLARKCPHCDAPQPIYSEHGGTRITWEWRASDLERTDLPPDLRYEMTRPFTAARARAIFDAVADEDLAYLGIDGDRAHPREYVLRVFPVPPPAIRPSIVRVEGSRTRGQDDLTQMIHSGILALNNVIRKLSFAKTNDATHVSSGFSTSVAFDEISADTLKRATKSSSKASRKEEARASRDRKMKERQAMNEGPPTAATHARGAKKAASGATTMGVCNTWREWMKGDLRAAESNLLPFDEDRIDVLLALTRPHANVAQAHLGARPGIRHCEALSELQGAVAEKIETLERQLRVYMVTDGKDHTKVFHRKSNAPMRTLRKRMDGKEGRMRINLMGKRSFGNARAVATPDNSIDVHQIGIPEAMACKLTVGGKTVNAINIEEMRERVRRGYGQLKGAEKIWKASEKCTLLLKFATDLDDVARNLKIGDVVHLHLWNGDVVLVNRQPSLHRMSIMAHEARVVEGNSIRANSAVCAAYNLDFDGDEVNIHVPQGEAAQAEARMLISVTRQLISPATNAPCFGIIQDGIVNGMLLTKRDTFLRKDQAMQLACSIRHDVPGKSRFSLPPPAILAPTPLWTGKQIFSILLPSYLQLAMDGGDAPEDPMLDDEASVLILDGELVRGKMNKKALGQSARGVVQRIAMDGNLETAIRFMSDAERMTHAWSATFGFSMGIDDCILEPNVHRYVRRTLRLGARAVDRAQRMMDELPKTSAQHLVVIAEQRIRTILGSVSQDAMQRALSWIRTVQNVRKTAMPRNGLWDMVTSGSKGSSANISQIAVMIGQQIVGGTRIARDLRLGRTLPCFAPWTPTPEAQGFCRNSYIDGLNNVEFFLHNMGGREGLVDTSTKTATSGYMQRRLCRALEDMVAMADGSIRDAKRRIVQFAYGGDGFDPTRLEFVDMDILTAPDVEVDRVSCGDAFFALTFLRARDDLRRHRVALGREGELERKILLPVDPERVVRDLLRKVGETESASEEKMEDVYEAVNRALGKKRSMWGLRLATLWALRPSVLRNRPALAQKTLSIVLDRAERARIAAGDPVGVIASQSIGEPSMQMTLNTFHHAGRGVARVTVGIPRLREIIERRHVGMIRSPLLVVPVRDDTRATAERVVRVLQRVLLREVLISSVVTHEDAVADLDRVLLRNVGLSHGTERDVVENPRTLSPYVVHFTLNRERLLQSAMGPVVMARCVERAMKGTPCTIIFSPRAMRRWVLRVRLVSEDPQMRTREAAQEWHMHLLKHAAVNQAHSISMAIAGQAELLEEEAASGAIVKRKRWVVQAMGSELASVATLPDLDWSRAHTNDITLASDVLGIEAANALLFEQLRSVMTNDGSHIDARHLQLLADAMTYCGYVMPVRRQGIGRKPTGWAHRASFEMTHKVLISGALRAEDDPLDNPSAAVMTGQLGAFGTGWTALMPEPRYGSMWKTLSQKAGYVNSTSYMTHALAVNPRFVDGSTGSIRNRDVRALQAAFNRGVRKAGIRGREPIPMRREQVQIDVTHASRLSLYVGAKEEYQRRTRPQPRKRARDWGGDGEEGEEDDERIEEVGERPTQAWRGGAQHMVKDQDPKALKKVIVATLHLRGGRTKKSVVADLNE